MKPGQRLDDAFRPLIGQFVWSVRRGHGTFLTMEFGAPHLTVREPIAASPGASPKVKKNLSRRRVTVVGDWHLWIKHAEWEIHTASFSMRSQDAEFAATDDALNERDGQTLRSASAWTVLNACVLEFDLGAYLQIWPSQHVDDDQWSIHEARGRIVSCRTGGSIIVENNAA